MLISKTAPALVVSGDGNIRKCHLRTRFSVWRGEKDLPVAWGQDGAGVNRWQNRSGRVKRMEGLEGLTILMLLVQVGFMGAILYTVRMQWKMQQGSKVLVGSVCAYMALTVLVGAALTALFGWWWIDSIISFGLTYFVVKEGIEAIQEARGVEDT